MEENKASEDGSREDASCRRRARRVAPAEPLSHASQRASGQTAALAELHAAARRRDGERLDEALALAADARLSVESCAPLAEARALRPALAAEGRALARLRAALLAQAGSRDGV